MKEYKSLADGREQIISLMFPSDFIDDLYCEKSASNFEALSEVNLCSFEKKPFEEFVDANTKVNHHFLASSINSLNEAREWMFLLGRKTAKEKVASFLIKLIDKTIDSKCAHTNDIHLDAGEIIKIPISRSDIGSYLGLTMETVCRQMTMLKQQNFIDVPDNSSFSVLNMDGLVKASGKNA